MLRQQGVSVYNLSCTRAAAVHASSFMGVVGVHENLYVYVHILSTV